MRTVMTIADKDMDDWRAICRAYARKVGAKVVFVNNTSMGLEFPNGTMKHIYVDELADALGWTGA